jgi:hypothetical protein
MTRECSYGKMSKRDLAYVLAEKAEEEAEEEAAAAAARRLSAEETRKSLVYRVSLAPRTSVTKLY